jgi:hypothetical protein
MKVRHNLTVKIFRKPAHLLSSNTSLDGLLLSLCVRSLCLELGLLEIAVGLFVGVVELSLCLCLSASMEKSI